MTIAVDGLPSQPRLHRSYYLIELPGSDGVLLYREGRGVRLRPAEDSRLLFELLTVLDGSRSVPEIVALLDAFDNDLVLSALVTLNDRGLLEDGTDRGPAAGGVAEARAAQRTLLSHLIPDHVDDAELALAESAVLIVGDGALATAIAAMLDTCGTGRVTALSPVALLPARSRVEPLRHPGTPLVTRAAQDVPATRDSAFTTVNMAVVALDYPDPELLEAVNAECLDRSVPLLPVALVGWEGHLGPTCIPGQTACVQCASTRAKANLSRYEEYLLYEEALRRRPGEHPFGHLPHFPAILAGLAATEIVKALTDCYPCSTYGRVLVFDLLSSESEAHDVLRVPRCSACGRLARHAQGKPPYRATDRFTGAWDEPRE